MATARHGDKVSVHYKGRLADGTVFDSSEGRTPLEFEIGRRQVIVGFEAAVTGLAEGQATTTTIPAAQAYGERRGNLVFRVPRTQLPSGMNPQVGQQLHMQQPNGRPVTVRVASTDKDSITLDANHELAGKDLTFEIRLVKIG